MATLRQQLEDAEAGRLTGAAGVFEYLNGDLTQLAIGSLTESSARTMTHLSRLCEALV